MIRLLIVDDHTLFREGLQHIIAHWDDFELVGQATNGEEALALAGETMPDLVLMDIHMPGMDGIETTRRMSRQIPSAFIVMLTVSEEEEYLFEAMKAGARGYLLKNTPSRRLRDLLRGVMHGETPFSGIMATKILEDFNKAETKVAAHKAAEIEPLSEREFQVLKLVATGLSNAEIATQLALTENTIKKYFHNILQKLALNNRVEAAVYAVRQGLIDP
jgi:DNA-binding NarL/FixJ family response regulator